MKFLNMRSHFKYFITLLFLMTMIGCKKEKAKLPEVVTSEMSIVTPASAIGGGSVISIGSAKLTERGLCWSEFPSPKIEENKAVAIFKSYPTDFETTISNLKPETKYYVRAYATSEAGTSYGEELTFTTPTELSGVIGTLTDVDANIYQTIGIGSQIWMAENLKTTKFKDGIAIPQVTGNSAWSFLFTPAYCWYNNDEASGRNIYGALYNWYTVGTGKLCPEGWHVPDEIEWTTLITYLGGPAIAGGEMKITGTEFWRQPNTGATNSRGFSGLPSGSRGDTGEFALRGEDLVLWTSSVLYFTYNPNCARYLALSSYGKDLTRGCFSLTNGFSIRCIRD